VWGRLITCSICEPCDEHCISGDGVGCAEAAFKFCRDRELDNEHLQVALDQLRWAGERKRLVEQ
jgi:hypothetical protein